MNTVVATVIAIFYGWEKQSREGYKYSPQLRSIKTVIRSSEHDPTPHTAKSLLSLRPCLALRHLSYIGAGESELHVGADDKGQNSIYCELETSHILVFISWG